MNEMNDSVDNYIKRMIKLNPSNIKAIDSPSKDLQMLAVRIRPKSIKHIKNLYRDVILEALRLDGNTIQYIDSDDEYYKILAVKGCGKAIKHIKNPSRDVQLAAINNDPKSIIYINNVTDEIYKYAMSKKN